MLEVDDSGFYAGEHIQSEFVCIEPASDVHVRWLCKSHPTQTLFVLGGPVPLVGVTITMDDEALNGTNRVVLDGVLSQSECDTMMQLASVSE